MKGLLKIINSEKNEVGINSEGVSWDFWVLLLGWPSVSLGKMLLWEVSLRVWQGTGLWKDLPMVLL